MHDMDLFVRISVLCFAFLSTLKGISEAEEFLGGCGGFVKSSVEINFSRIEVKLYTRQGALKYQTDCAPNNGYFMIPIYDKGDFILKLEPPTGWTFDPVSVDLHIDGETDKCSRGEDINFQFTGFTVTGNVVSKGQQEGPAGVTVSLKAKGKVLSNNKLPQEQVESTVFLKSCGDYVITASHPKWTFDQPDVVLVVSHDSGGESAPIIVSGYDVQGQVLSEGEPIKDVYFILFSQTITQKAVSGCNTSPLNGFEPPAGKSALCSVQSNQQGIFVFPSLPTGAYSVVPFYKGEHITFDVIPTSMNFSVKHDSLKLKMAFRVEGFSVTGKVVLSSGGQGVAGAKVIVQGKKEVTTKADGSFQLEKIKSDKYVITVQKEHVFFEPTTMKINPNTPRLPDIVASSFSVCGRVNIDKPPVKGSGSRQITLTPEGGKPKDSVTKATQNDGSYCFEVKPGVYEIQPAVSDEETKAGLKLVPAKLKVTVRTIPEFDVNFSQFKATLRGAIKCLDVCGNLQMKITTEDGRDERPLVQISQQTKTAPFQLRDVLPGKYKVTVVQSNWCLESPTLEVSVGEDDVEGLEFKQKGYLLQCHTSHPTALHYHHSKSPKDSHKFDLSAGLNQYCLDKPGKYQLEPKSCHQFDRSSYSFDTSSPNMLTLTAIKHLVTGVVNTKQQASDVTITIKSSIETEAATTLGPLKSKEQLIAETKKKANDTKAVVVDGPGTYEFSHWARSGERLEITPSSGQILFYPHMVDITIKTGSGCVGQVAEFEGRAGVFVAGQVTPALKGVKVTVTVKSTIKDGEETRPPINMETDQNGKYRVGPLPDTAEYTVTAVMNGYILTQVEGQQTNFVASKLGDITVKVVDEADIPLQGVYLSLTGGQFRSNNLTDADGTKVFLDLKPDQYFLRALMKEYKFEPGSQMLDVAEGASEKLLIRGQRVAFSCFGSVTSLNGEPEPKIALEAQGIDSCGEVLEESVSDQDGQFRIRGLQPKCTYELRLQSGGVNSHIERSAPKSHVIKVEGKDIENIRIIVFRRLNQFEIGGNVITASEFVQTLKVLLYSEDNLDSPLQTLSLGTSSFFQFPSLPIDNKKYVMRLESSLSKTSYEYTLPEASFSTQGYHRHITLHFEPTKRNVEQEISQGSYLALPLLVAVIAIALNHAKILPVLQQMFQSVRTYQPAGGVAEGSKEFGAGGDEKKKKPKPRKT
ncbi:LOW QUALITY PROTEIN: BOS complex subunit NOMO1-like [Amphiura filiformis]|uniref:LOW QUALITY PROTEIN: BOS complex subunit NOMO1-like n=1 Tax=Amphiura filiformis TaxID=82378 RepID=UPI003B20DB16